MHETAQSNYRKPIAFKMAKGQKIGGGMRLWDSGLPMHILKNEIIVEAGAGKVQSREPSKSGADSRPGVDCETRHKCPENTIYL